MPEKKRSGAKHAPTRGKNKKKNADTPKNMEPRINEGQGLDREVGQFSGEGTPAMQKK